MWRFAPSFTAFGRVIGTENGPDEQVEKVWRAAARAQLTTGLPMTTHNWVGNGAVWCIGILREEGADLSKVVIGHVGANRPDMELARWILTARPGRVYFLQRQGKNQKGIN